MNVSPSHSRPGNDEGASEGNGRSEKFRLLFLSLRCSLFPPSALRTAAFSARCSPSVLLAPSAAALESASERELRGREFLPGSSSLSPHPLPRKGVCVGGGVRPPPAPSHARTPLAGDGRSLSNPPGHEGVGMWAGGAEQRRGIASRGGERLTEAACKEREDRPPVLRGGSLQTPPEK